MRGGGGEHVVFARAEGGWGEGGGGVGFCHDGFGFLGFGFLGGRFFGGALADGGPAVVGVAVSCGAGAACVGRVHEGLAGFARGDGAGDCGGGFRWREDALVCGLLGFFNLLGLWRWRWRDGGDLACGRVEEVVGVTGLELRGCEGWVGGAEGSWLRRVWQVAESCTPLVGGDVVHVRDGRWCWCCSFGVEQVVEGVGG